MFRVPRLMIPGANEPSGTEASQFGGAGAVERIPSGTEEEEDISMTTDAALDPADPNIMTNCFQVGPEGCTTADSSTVAISTPQKNRPQCNANSDTKVEKPASVAHQINDEDRYVVITYAVEPENPEWHRERCFVLYKGRKSDDVMRTYVAAHIKMTWPPPHIEIHKATGEMMETTAIVEPHEWCATPCSTLKRVQGHTLESPIDEQKNEYISDVYDFSPPIYDHEQYTVRIRIVRAWYWNTIRLCLETHRNTQCRHTPFVITYNNENRQTTDMTWINAMHM